MILDKLNYKLFDRVCSLSVTKICFKLYKFIKISEDFLTSLNAMRKVCKFFEPESASGCIIPLFKLVDC